MDFGLKMVKFRCLAARFFFVQHMKILRAARNFTKIFEVTARKTWGKHKKTENTQENLTFSIVYRNELKSVLYIITIGKCGQKHV